MVIGKTKYANLIVEKKITTDFYYRKDFNLLEVLEMCLKFNNNNNHWYLNLNTSILASDKWFNSIEFNENVGYTLYVSCIVFSIIVLIGDLNGI